MTAPARTLTPDTTGIPVSGAGAYAGNEPQELDRELDLSTNTEALRLLAAAFPAAVDLPIGSRDAWPSTFDHTEPSPATPSVQLENALDTHLGTASRGTAHRAAVARGTTDDYWTWLGHVQAAAACTHPVRLAGDVHTVDGRTGEIVSTANTGDMPDGVIYKACGNRRATVCPACAETYRADTYQLISAGLQGGKGVPATVATHPCAFPTFTAPSFGLVHSTREKDGRPQPCRPRRKPALCPHGADLRCARIHADGEKILGTPLCLDCYDHDHQVVWNAFAGELWRRTMETAKHHLSSYARAHGVKARPSFAKVAEMQARGVAHFHALIRLDGIDEDDPAAIVPVRACLDFFVLRAAINTAAKNTRFRTPPHPDNPAGWLIEWGDQLVTKPVRLTVDGAITETAVAGYLAKYATKATEATGHVSRRITADTVDLYADPYGSHVERLIDACWRLGRPGADLDPDQATRNSGRMSYTRLRRWAHMLGFGGHFSTKSRRYSTTLRALREARQTWRRDQLRTAEHLDADEETTLIVGVLTYAGTGWRTTGDALLANTAAAKAREHARIAREEAAHELGSQHVIASAA